MAGPSVRGHRGSWHRVLAKFFTADALLDANQPGIWELCGIKPRTKLIKNNNDKKSVEATAIQSGV